MRLMRLVISLALILKICAQDLGFDLLLSGFGAPEVHL